MCVPVFNTYHTYIHIHKKTKTKPKQKQNSVIIGRAPSRHYLATNFASYTGDDPPGAWSPTRGNEVIENRIHLGLEGSSLQPPSRLSPITTTVSADGFAFGGYVVVLL